MKHERARAVGATLALSLLFAIDLSAQDWKGKARIEGRVSNEKGEPIAGATVQLRRYGAGPDVKTDKKGRWAYLGLAGGPWDVDVVAEGFQPRKVSVRLSEIDRLPPMQMGLEVIPQAAAAPARRAGSGTCPLQLVAVVLLVATGALLVIASWR